MTFTAADRQFLLAVSRRIVGDADAADVAQDALLLAYRNRERFRGDSRYHTWLFKIAMSVGLSHLRRRRRRSVLHLGAAENDALTRGDVATPEELLERAQEHRRLQQEISRLDPAYSDVFRLRFERGLSEPAVARALGLSVSNVKIRAFRARRKLRDAVQQAA
ncbi:MAG: sigma-70 family RNA polymerase sigma factor [Kofleriaceae bacterium]